MTVRFYLVGEVVVMLVATAGVGVVAIVIGAVREFLQRKIFGDHDIQMKLLAQLELNNKLTQQMLEQPAKLAALFEQRLTALEQPAGEPGAH